MFDDDNASRRSFLKLAGFGLATLTVGCSRGKVTKAIPYLVPPEEIVPGRSYRIATTCAGCTASCAMVATCRDGRPTKLEGNALQSWSGGGLCAVGQATLLSLYDSRRLDSPRRARRSPSPRTDDDAKPTLDRGIDPNFESLSWKQADDEIKKRLATARARGGRVRVLTGTVTSPSTLAAIEAFLATFEDGRHVMYDPLSSSAILDAHLHTHGTRSLPRFRFDRARVIAAFDADFLGTWISPVEFSRGYAAGRRPDDSPPILSHHVHFESRTSLTGSRADERVTLAPWETATAITRLCEVLSKKSRIESPVQTKTSLPSPVAQALDRLADELWSRRGESLVVCGTNDRDVQALVNRINEILGNYGKTLDLARPSLQKKGDDGAVVRLVEEMKQGKVDALIVQGVNPAYDLPGELGFTAACNRVGLVIRHGSHPDETGQLADFLGAESHALESWNDTEAIRGSFSLTQPTVPPLRQGRTLRETLARWAGNPARDRDLIRDHWRSHVWPGISRSLFTSFDRFFAKALHDGCTEIPEDPAASSPGFVETPFAAPTPPAAPATGTLALVLYPKVALLDGSHAHNPWLQELPDPVTKIAWDNYACLSPKTAEAMALDRGDLVTLTVGDGKLELPVVIQPGQHDRVVAVALGYGRAGTDRFTNVGPAWIEARPTVAEGGHVGVNAAPFLQVRDDAIRHDTGTVKLTRSRGRVDLACSQDYHSLEVPSHLAPPGAEVRDAARHASLSTWTKDPDHAIHHGGHEGGGSLWPEDHPKDGPRWGLAVDLTACNGCSACVVGCQAENNVPVVGRDEVRRHREMHWIRIDRYYQGEGDDLRVEHQPMMCQHCENAPCETVCPVLATVHSKEGLNQQVYNRCVGTRYCANNCPYKVRRFNWFDYPREDRLQNMSLNPDVTIRTRGVMEKCSLCAQRIQGAKAEARRSGKEVEDGAIQVACQQTCPSSAIVFGDLNDPGSEISRKVASKRSYTVLSELNTKPGIHYLARIVNRKDDGHGDADGHPTSS